MAAKSTTEASVEENKSKTGVNDYGTTTVSQHIQDDGTSVLLAGRAA